VATNPDELADLIGLASSLAQQDEYGIRAIEANRRIIELWPDGLDARNRLARCHLFAGELEEARRVYTATLAIAPADSIARNGLREIDQRQSGLAAGGRSSAGSAAPAVDHCEKVAPDSRLGRALDGLATDPADMVDALLHVDNQLRRKDLEWIRDMDQTAAGFRSFTGFTPRQREVIRDIYRRYFPRRTR
jgi:hypothetical protein